MEIIEGLADRNRLISPNIGHQVLTLKLSDAIFARQESKCNEDCAKEEQKISGTFGNMRTGFLNIDKSHPPKIAKTIESEFGGMKKGFLKCKCNVQEKNKENNFAGMTQGFKKSNVQKKNSFGGMKIGFLN